MTLSDEIRTAIDGKWGHVREQARATMPGMDLAFDHSLTIDQARARVLEQMALKCSPNSISPSW